MPGAPEALVFFTHHEQILCYIAVRIVSYPKTKLPANAAKIGSFEEVYRIKDATVY